MARLRSWSHWSPTSQVFLSKQHLPPRPCSLTSLSAMGISTPWAEMSPQIQLLGFILFLHLHPPLFTPSCSQSTLDGSRSSSLIHGPASSICRGSICWENQFFCICAVRMSLSHNSKCPRSWGILTDLRATLLPVCGNMSHAIMC